jgi:acetolactate synthase-1/2/3 large subunit
LLSTGWLNHERWVRLTVQFTGEIGTRPCADHTRAAPSERDSFVAQVEAPVRGAQDQAIEQKRVMTGGQALVAMLKREGVDTLFALPGVQLDGFFEALWDEQDSFRVYHTRHEQATAYMADGYARVSGKEGVFVVVPGPGLLNATAALSTAYACNSPVLCVTGQIRSDLIEAGRGLLHEIPNQLGMIRSVTKHAARAVQPAAIPNLVDNAFRQLRSGRPRPVEIEAPPDTLFAQAEVTLLPPAPPRARSAGDPDLIEQAAKLLGRATSPAIYAGGGILRSGASAELLALAEMLQAPVVVSRNGKGAISDRNYLAHGWLADRGLYAQADVVLAVGTRFTSDFDDARPIGPGQAVIQLDVDPEEIGRNTKPTIAIEADAKAGLAALVERVPAHNRIRASREAELSALKAAGRKRLETIAPQVHFTDIIRAELPDEGILVSEMTQIGYYATFGYPVYQPNTYLTPGYQGTLGSGFCMSLGAKVGKSDVPVVSINGDGGFGFTMNELATMAQHQIGVVALVFNDGAYGNVRRMQKYDYNNKIIASELDNPDFVKLAAAFGIAGRRVHTPDELRVALREAIAAGEPALIEVPVEEMPNPWKLLGLR